MSTVLFAAVPEGLPSDDTFSVVPTPAPEDAPGGARVQLLALSVDPYMRGRMRVGVKSYTAAFEVGKPMEGSVVAEVKESNHSNLKAGDVIAFFGKWSTEQVLTAEQCASVTKLPPGTPPGVALGVLGGTGLTAYFGFLRVGEAKEGDSVLVTGAAGATGMAVVQIAKLKGCRVVGVAGGADKCEFVRSIGADAVIDYKAPGVDLAKEMAAAAPDGFDVFYDNVGGEIFEAAFPHMRDFGRIVQCGAISTYNVQDTPPPNIAVWHIIAKRLKWQGFIITDFMKEWGTAIQDLSKWLQEGKLKDKTTEVKGIENAGKAFVSLFSGANTGKLYVSI